MKKIAFTICSNNYLAQAKTLGDSLCAHNPGYQFIICLVDTFYNEIDYTFFEPHELLVAGDVPIGNFEEMVGKYNIVELNTAVKPFVFQHLFNSHPSVETIIYFDPDIQVYGMFDEIDKGFVTNDFIITPHFTHAINDGFLLSEEAILNCGLYNLGFIALKRTEMVFHFLVWWMERMKDRCYVDFTKGLFVDQIWINLLPLYYEDVYIMKHPGYNMAYWNLHERSLQTLNDSFIINNQYPLVFYHFSGFNPLIPESISKYQNRFSFQTRPDIVSFFTDYKELTIQNNHAYFSTVPCHYVLLREKFITEQKMKEEAEIVRKQVEWEEAKKNLFKNKVKAKIKSVFHLKH